MDIKEPSVGSEPKLCRWFSLDLDLDLPAVNLNYIPQSKSMDTRMPKPPTPKNQTRR